MSTERRPTVIPDRHYCNGRPDGEVCRRRPEPGWAFCPPCLKAWLDGQHR